MKRWEIKYRTDYKILLTWSKKKYEFKRDYSYKREQVSLVTFTISLS